VPRESSQRPRFLMEHSDPFHCLALANDHEGPS
jgi:hypothetical protein